MRSVKLTGLAALVLTACSIQVGTGGGNGSPQAPQARRAPAPPPPRPAAPLPRAAPAPAPAPVQKSAVAPPTAEAGVNLARVRELRARNPKPCGYVEVAPGNWVHVDCEQYKSSSRAVAHLSMRKLKLVTAHKTLFRPIAAIQSNDLVRKNKSLIVAPGLAGGGSTAVGAARTPFGGPNQTAEAFPATVDHRAENLESPVKNQGGVGSCTAHSLSAALDNAAIRAGVLKPGDRDRMTSPLHIWSRYGLPDMGAAADGNIAQPVGVYTTWPQNDAEACKLFQQSGSFADDCRDTYNVKPGSWRSDSALMAKYNKSQSEGVYKISSIEKLDIPPNIEEMQNVLATGADIWAAFLIDFPAWSNSGMTNGVIPNYTTKSGGHAVVISGYRSTPTGRQFLIHNSWGESWGDKGYAWVTEATVTKWLYYAYKVKITNGVPKESLTDDDCAPDELVDLGTGLCAVMCDTGDGRPNNGCKK